jgi:hypothetical protein
LVSVSVFGQAKCPDKTTPRDRPLEIVEKPKASYPKGENVEAQGTVTLRVEFLPNAKIGRIDVIKGLPHGLTEQAIAAARKMVFKPAVKNCEAITVFKPVSYTFNYY